MFKLSEKSQIDRRILKCVCIRYSPSEISTINTPNSQIFNIFPRRDSVYSLKGCLLRLNFVVLHAATNNRYADGNDIKLTNLGLIALFNIYKLVRSSEKHIEEINHARIVCLMYKLITSCRGSDDLSIGFDRSHDRGKKRVNWQQKNKRQISCDNYVGCHFRFLRKSIQSNVWPWLPSYINKKQW